MYIYDVMRLDLHKMAKEDEQSDSPLIEVIAFYCLNPMVFNVALISLSRILSLAYYMVLGINIFLQ